MPSVPLGDFQVSAGGLENLRAEVEEIIVRGDKAYCVPLNVTKYSMAKSDSKLRSAIQRARFVTADGLPIRWLCHKIGHRHVQRVTGIDLAEACLDLANEHGFRIFLFGAQQRFGLRAVANLQQRYRNLKVAGYRNGFFSNEHVGEIIEEINLLRPEMVFLGLGLPQKEHFIHDHFDQLETNFCIAVGGAFDIWAEEKSRAPALVQQAGLEWLYRSVSNFSKFSDLIRHGGGFAKDYFFHYRKLRDGAAGR